MTITVLPARNEYTATAGQTVFNYTFKIFSDTDLNVYITPAGQDANDSTDITTMYTVDPSGIDNEDGGFITLSNPTNSGDLVTIVSNVPSSRTIDYQNNGDFRPDTVNLDFDTVVSITKKIEDTVNRTVVLPQSQQGPKPLSLPNPQSGYGLRWNGDETGLENYDPSTVSNEEIANDKVVISYSTVNAAINDDSLKINQACNIKEYSDSSDGGAMWDVYPVGTFPVNFDVINHTSLPLQIKIRDAGSLTVEAFGAGTPDDTGLFNFFVGKDYRPIANGQYNVTAIPSDISMYRGNGSLILPTGERVPMGEDFKQSTINAVRPIPDADLSWVPFFPKVDSVGNVTTTQGVSYYAIERENPASAGDYYIDPINGNDANAGSPGLPIETLNEFLRVRPGNNGYMMGSDDPDNPVVFAKSDFRDTDPVGNRLKIVNVNGHCRIADPVDDLASLTWTLESGQVYKCTTTSALINQLRYTKALDEDGGFLKIPSFTNITDVNNSLFGFWHDVGNNTLYARIGSTAGDTFKTDLQPIVSDANSKMLFLGTPILFYCPKGSSLQFDGIYLQPLVSGSTRPRLYLHAEEPNAIEIKNTFTHGVDALGAECYSEHVKITSTGGDNFHWFDSAGVSTLAVEVNCESSFAGDVGTRGSLAAGTDNGSAMHGTGHVARFGGKYYKNYGPDVVDSGTGAFWNCGVEAFGSTIPSNAIGFDITAGPGRMYLDTCLARDEDLDEIQVNDGAVLRTFNTTGEVTEVGTGVEYAYDPLNPL